MTQVRAKKAGWPQMDFHLIGPYTELRDGTVTLREELWEQAVKEIEHLRAENRRLETALIDISQLVQRIGIVLDDQLEQR